MDKKYKSVGGYSANYPKGTPEQNDYFIKLSTEKALIAIANELATLNQTLAGIAQRISPLDKA